MARDNLIENFNAHHSGEGPSIPPEKLAEIPIFKACGSTIPLNPHQ